MPRLLQLAVVLLAALTAVFLWARQGGVEGQLRRQLAAVEELVAKEAGETRLAGLERARRIAGLMTAEFEVRAPPLEFATRDGRELARAIYGYRSRRARIVPRFYDVGVAPEVGTGRAVTTFTAEFNEGFLPGGDAYRFRIEWTQGEGGWRMARVDLLEVLSGGRL